MFIIVGDTVKWRSQSQGRWTEKVGKVTHVVPPGKYPPVRIPGTCDPWNGQMCSLTRKQVSYVVRVGSKNYWPRVSALVRADQPLPD